MEPTYELRPTKSKAKDKRGHWYFVFKAGNGEILFTSEDYDSKDNAKRGVDTVRRATAQEAITTLVGQREGETFQQVLAVKAAKLTNIEDPEES